MKWDNNYFYGGSNGAFLKFYSRHFPTEITNNTFYDTQEFSPQLGYGDGSEYQKSMLAFNGDGFTVTGNRFIDDRALNTPTTAPTLSQVSAGSLGATTYFARYTFANESGETSSSTNASLGVSANNLLKVTIGGTPPPGTRAVNIYIGTASGTEQWQGSFAYPTTTLAWTMPATGLIASSTAPTSNTTHVLTKYGIYELSGGPANRTANVYRGNDFIGVSTPIFTLTSYNHLSQENTYASSTESSDIINLPWTASSTMPVLTIDATTTQPLVLLRQEIASSG